MSGDRPRTAAELPEPPEGRLKETGFRSSTDGRLTEAERRRSAGRILDMARLRDVLPPPNLVARVMTRVSEPRLPSVWQWLRRPVVIEVRISPLVLFGLALALGAAFVYVGAMLK